MTEKYYKNFLENNPYPRQMKNDENKALINFSSNDYLGLTKHPQLIQRAQEFAAEFGVGSASSRLVCGNLAIYEKLEKQLAQAVGKPAALILGTGFQTNFSVLEALLDSTVLTQEPLVFCDRLCHVSMLASTRHVARIQRFQHNDLRHLENLLEKYSNSDKPKFILAESIYSMDGDQADIPGLIALAKKHRAYLYIDDAHAVGIYGPQGWGKAAEYSQDVDIVMGTFSKALGSFGGYIACSETVRDYLINKCKGLIYSTGLPPMVLGAIAAMIELLPSLQNERARVITNAQKLHSFFQEQGLNYGTANTHIVPWIIGDAEKTLHASRLLKELSIHGTTIRPPTVPKDRCRIRFCISAAHSDQDLIHLMNAIQKVEQKL